MGTINRLPGMLADKDAVAREVVKSGAWKVLLPGGVALDGSGSRDPLNTGDLPVIRAGMLLGRITTTKLWAPAIIGLVTADYTSGATEITVSAATAVEIVRRVGASGTLTLTHAPTATGTVVPYATLTYSAVNVTTGVLTITNIGANVETGAIVGPPVADGSYIPRAILGNAFGIKVTDEAGTDVDVPASEIIIGGVIDTANILNWPAAANTTLDAWLKGVLRLYGVYAFSNDLG